MSSSASSIVSPQGRVGPPEHVHTQGIETRNSNNTQKDKRTQLNVVRSYRNFMHNMHSWTEGVRQNWSDRHRTALPMSPRGRDLADIYFLQDQHRKKMKDLMARESEGFDFCLIL